MAEDWRNWKHITKLDPDRKISHAVLRAIMQTGTDAIMISGTQRVTREKVVALLKMLKEYDIPKVLEPANPRGIVYRDVDWIFVPTVFNTKNQMFVNGMHEQWIKADKDINWDIVIPEAYIILNPKCAAAKVTNAKPIPKEDVVAAAICAERYFKIPIVYIEYSGMYGDPEIVKSVRKSLKSAHLIYGGGINSEKRAREMRSYATIVVGNTIYENGAGSFVDTMRGNLLHELEAVQGRLRELHKMRKQLEEKYKSKKEHRK